MAGFLRKKTKSKQDPPASTSSPALPTSSATTPLFSKFSSATQQQQQQDVRPSARMVSGPMQLGGTNALKRIPTAQYNPRDGANGYGGQRRAGAGGWEEYPQQYYQGEITQPMQQAVPSARLISQQTPIVNGRPSSNQPVREGALPRPSFDRHPQAQAPPMAPTSKPNDPKRVSTNPQLDAMPFDGRYPARAKSRSAQGEKQVPVLTNNHHHPALTGNNMSDTALPDMTRRLDVTSNSHRSNAYTHHPITHPINSNESNDFAGANRTTQIAAPSSFNFRGPSSAATDQGASQTPPFRTSLRSPFPQVLPHLPDPMNQPSGPRATSMDWGPGAQYALQWLVNQQNGSDPQEPTGSPPRDVFVPPQSSLPMIDRRQDQTQQSLPNGVVPSRNGSLQRPVQSPPNLLPGPPAPARHKTLTKVKPNHPPGKPPLRSNSNRVPSPTLPSIQVPPEDFIPNNVVGQRRSIMLPQQTYNLAPSMAPAPYGSQQPMANHPPQFSATAQLPRNSGSIRANAPVRGKPRIFSAMEEDITEQPEHPEQPQQPQQRPGPGPIPTNDGGWTNGPSINIYSPPPALEPAYVLQRDEVSPPQEAYAPAAPYGRSSPQHMPVQYQYQAMNEEPSSFYPTPPPSMGQLNGNGYPIQPQYLPNLSPHFAPEEAEQFGYAPQSPARTKAPMGPRDSPPNSYRNRPTSPFVAGRPMGIIEVASNSTITPETGSLLDDDPFARTDGVRMLKPTGQENGISNGYPPSRRDGGDGLRKVSVGSDDNSSMVTAEEEPFEQDEDIIDTPVQATGFDQPSFADLNRQGRIVRREEWPQTPPPEIANLSPREDRPPEPFPLLEYLSFPQFLSHLLSYSSFYDWCMLSSVSKEIRIMLVKSPPLREAILERFLKTVGYSRWIYEDSEPLSLSLQDLHDYMRGVSTPTHEYNRVADMYVHSLKIHPSHRDPSLNDLVRQLTASTRAYTRVVLRLRAQAEKETSIAVAMAKSRGDYNTPARGWTSRASSRAPSPSRSSYSHSHQGHGGGGGGGGGYRPQGATTPPNGTNNPLATFKSPLFRLRRAPLLRVFVPSPEGNWLSDKSVLECEAELKRGGVAHLLRLGDIAWDVAVGDEGNVGRLVWDGMYLIDLDYSYSIVGDLPKYLPTLAFPPSYFHRVIRTGPSTSNPIAHINVTPWGEEIAANLQLIQDRVRTETPQGNYHNVVRWVHRSSFVIKPPPKPRRAVSRNGNAAAAIANVGIGTNIGTNRIPVPNSNLFVDSGWYGTIVVETEGTNESLADLQTRCGPGAFPPRTMAHPPTQREKENMFVWRIIREKSRPGEIWMRTVNIKERLI